MGSGVTASISTKDRYFSTLPLAIAAITQQTVLPDKLYIFDDGEHKDIRPYTPYNSLFRMLTHKGIDWEWIWAPRQGQVRNHQDALDRAKTPFVWRCFRGIDKVETSKGLKNIRDIKIGDLVKTHKGRLKKVLKTHKTPYPERKPLVFVRTPYSVIRCTPEHPVLANENGTFVAAGDIKPGMRLFYPCQQQEDVLSVGVKGRRTLNGRVSKEGAAIDLDTLEVDMELARFFGLYLAEGCGGHDSIRFTFGNHELEYISFVSKVCHEKFKRIPTIHKRWATTVKLNIRSLSARFTSWFGKNARCKRIPKFVFDWNLQNRLSFILGYLDGDGWSHGKFGRRFTTASKQLFEDLSKLLVGCGLSAPVSYDIKPSTSHHEGNLIKSVGGYQGTIHKAAIGKIFDLVNASRVNASLLAIPVVAVEPHDMPTSEDQYVYNLEVEEDNTYIVGSAIVHNCDDDNLPEPRVLETLLEKMKDPAVGAAGGLVIFPTGMSPRPKDLSGKMEDIFHPFGNIQWNSWDGPDEEVDHLYSTFLYRVEAARKAGGYPKDLSIIGHHEETTFSHMIKRAGYRLLVTPKTITWHLRDEQGGIRTFKDPSLWAADSAKFLGRLRDWGVRPRQFEVAVLDNGIGDHIVFRKGVLPDLQKKHAGKRLILAVCYPEVFEGVEGISLASIAEAKAAFGSLEKWNVYVWAGNHNWKGSLEAAFRGLYGLEEGLK